MPASPHTWTMFEPLYCQPQPLRTISSLLVSFHVPSHFCSVVAFEASSSKPLFRCVSISAQATPPLVTVASSLYFQTLHQ
ncbi:MAG: hypothetical protein BWY59_00520 [Verrucomicrobia bacterium ADurb.Bin345]|nr:MAG: hypothetical protein BWY59_00520 [Verrucomicrobia bacterium ADurb.Bin345]